MAAAAYFRALIAAGLFALATPAHAEIKVTIDKKYYKIAGRNGEALLDAMDRYGPKHGFLTRAIAQTRYSVTWEIEWAESGGTCRVRSSKALLEITYTYPKLTGPVPAALDKRWNRFVAGVRKHEEMHGRIAREMVAAAEKSVKGFATRNDQTCGKSKREVKRRVDEIYSAYEARQVAFDKAEHADGGAVQGLVAALLRR